MRHTQLITLLLATVLVASCLETPSFAPRIEDANFAPELSVDLAASTRTHTGLYYRDLVVGAGEAVRQADGDTALVRYTGYLRNGVVFDSNLTATSPLRFATGESAVIDGFDEGVRGMRVGGQRQLIIPPRLGYGAAAINGIPANSILVFNVTLTGVLHPATD